MGQNANSQISISSNESDLAQWSFDAKKENNKVIITANCLLKDDWHIFSSKEFGDGTISPTQLSIEHISDEVNHPIYTEKGNLIDSEIEGIGPVKYFLGKASYQIEFEAPQNSKTFKGEIAYQICNEVMCQAPTTKSFTVTLK